MRGPNEYSSNKRVRSFEKGTLRKVYKELCEPGDHHRDCPQRPQVCPHAEERP